MHLCLCVHLRLYKLGGKGVDEALNSLVLRCGRIKMRMYQWSFARQRWKSLKPANLKGIDFHRFRMRIDIVKDSRKYSRRRDVFERRGNEMEILRETTTYAHIQNLTLTKWKYRDTLLKLPRNSNERILELYIFPKCSFKVILPHNFLFIRG